MVTITREFIERYAFSEKRVSNINKSQCVILGLEFMNMPKGWVDREYKVSNACAELFKQLNNMKGKRNQSIVISAFKKASRSSKNEQN